MAESGHGLIVLLPELPALWVCVCVGGDLEELHPQEGKEMGVRSPRDDGGEQRWGKQGQTVDGPVSHAQLEGPYICKDVYLQATDTNLG